MSLHLLKRDAQTESLRHGETVDILGIPLASLTREALTEALAATLKEGKKGWFSYVNIHAVNLAQDIPWFRDFLKRSFVNYCDGAGVRLGSAILGHEVPERIVMMDWVEDVCRLAQREGYRIYFLGSTTQNVRLAVQRLRDRYPRLQVSGYHNGYFDSMENKLIVSEINNARTDILIVGMGMPLQERWILDNLSALSIHLVLNGGSCFDFISGAKPRCPRWLGRMGFEWLFRLLIEPRRLWRRYLIGNPRFLISVLKRRFANHIEE